jgi:MarR family transcriptional regulator for hemolysin
MQLLSLASKTTAAEEVCARQLLDTVPLVMRVIRQHMRRHRSGLTVPQFRTLCFVSSTEGSSLSAAADFIGLSLPAMSRLVEGLVEHGLMERRPCEDDRRHVRLSVTADGETALAEARQLAQAGLSDAVTRMTPGQREAIVKTMQVLRDVFTSEVDGS